MDIIIFVNVHSLDVLFAFSSLVYSVRRSPCCSSFLFLDFAMKYFILNYGYHGSIQAVPPNEPVNFSSFYIKFLPLYLDMLYLFECSILCHTRMAFND